MNNLQVRNSFYLLSGSLVTAGFGFIFWIIAARLFDASIVGVATVLISLSTLVSLLSLAGFDSSFVRFLPKSTDKNNYTNSGVWVSTILSIVLSLVFLAGAYYTTPSIRDIISNPLVVLLFVILTVASSLNLLTNSVFLAYRQAKYVLIINLLFNIVKVTLPFAFISYGAIGIFIAAGIAQLVGLGISLYIMHRNYGFNLLLKLDRYALKQTFSYTFSIYIGSVLNLAPPTVLPLIIASQLNTASTAYYYMAFNIATIIFTIAYSATQSAFAESSHDESKLRASIYKSVKLSVLLIVPAVVIALLFGKQVLHVFGDAYAESATSLLVIFSISAFFVTIYSALGAILKIAHDHLSFIMMNTFYALTVVGGSIVLIDQYGLSGIGYAWISGNIIAIVTGSLFHYRFRAKLREVR
jgi:O-antigen/teichoic acid export membrane protein